VEVVPGSLRCPPQTELREVPSFSNGSMVPGVCFTRRSDYNTENLQTVEHWPPPRDTQVKDLPQTLYLLQDVHCRIFWHRQATFPSHWRETDLPVVPEGRCCFPMLERVTLFGNIDESNVGIGGVPSQIWDSWKWVVACYRRTLFRAEKNYCMTQWQLMAIVKTVDHFRKYLYGQQFRLST
jgi:hypothetical protein